MNKLDLIIDEIMQARMFIEPKSIADFHTSRAVAAARELRDMGPVAFMGTDPIGNPNKFRLASFNGSEPLYALGDTDEQIRSD